MSDLRYHIYHMYYDHALVSLQNIWPFSIYARCLLNRQQCKISSGMKASPNKLSVVIQKC